MSERQAMDLVKSAKEFGLAKAAEWRSLVVITCGVKPVLHDRAAKRLAEGTKVGAKTLKRKMDSILVARTSGLTVEQIVDAGQEKILGQFVTTKVKARTLPLVAFPHKMTRPVRDDLETVCQWIAWTLKLKTWDEVFEFILGCFAGMTEVELRHQAGEIKASEIRKGVVVCSKPPSNAQANLPTFPPRHDERPVESTAPSAE